MRVAAVLADDDLRLEVLEQVRRDGVERPQPTLVPVPAGTAMLTAEPSASGPPTSVGKPVPGNSVSGDSWMEMVSTRGSFQKTACTPSP